LLRLGAHSVGVLYGSGDVEHSFPKHQPLVHLAVVPVVSHLALPRISSFGPRVIEIDLSSGQPGAALRCRFQGNVRDLRHLQRHLNRAFNNQRSGQVIAGMVLLLALCGWIIGGEDGALSAAMAGAPVANDADAVSPDAVRRQFGAHLLLPPDMPALFQVLAEICRRARLQRMPDLYYLAAAGSMNAYAVGSAERSAIILTEGLLRGMTPAEITSILAHEVAHIRNDDAWAMGWAAAMGRAIAQTALSGLQGLASRRMAAPLAALLASAPVIAQLLWLALSRLRELDADAVALDLVDDPRALVAALGKLERHHTGVDPVLSLVPSDDQFRLLRSHPATWERVDILLKLAA
jgi:heat shock protein HtpX